MQVPFLDLKSHHQPHREEFDRAIGEVIDLGAFAGGKFVEGFEKEFAAYCEAGSAIAVGSGTEALWLALMAHGVGLGDEVITVPDTFIATAEAISICGATPVFIDVDEKTYNMDPVLLSGAITEKTKAIIPVHLFGLPADMDPILEIAAAHGLAVIEDAAQAHGARYKGRRAGSMGTAGCFSFYPGKNLGAFGEGGAILTNDTEFGKKIRMLRDHGQEQKFQHRMVGWNCRMDGIQGAVLSIKLRYLDESNRGRRRCAAQYDEALRKVDGVITPYCPQGVEHCYHVYGVRVQHRDAVFEALNAAGIGCNLHYPVPIQLQAAYRDLPYAQGSFPVAERSAAEFLSLPMYPELSSEQVEAVVSTLKEAVGRTG